MSQRTAAQKRYKMSSYLAKSVGGSVLGYFADASYCSSVHGASPENYFVLRFFDMPDKKRRDFLTSGRSKAVDAELNRNATPRDRAALGHKDVFDHVFAGLMRRDNLYAPRAGKEEVFEFLDAHETVILKPRNQTQGLGIEKIPTPPREDWEEFYDRCVGQSILLEQVITQHPEVDKISPGCVNSLRIVTARDTHGRVRPIGAALRCGGVGAVVDNFHSGGVAYTVSTETGAVCAPGRDNRSLNQYVHHPGSLCLMPGFRLPFWRESLDCAKAAMELVPTMGYVGWDIALTPHGPELIEGNFSYPGGNIIQFDGVGKYPLVCECLGRRGR